MRHLLLFLVCGLCAWDAHSQAWNLRVHVSGSKDTLVYPYDSKQEAINKATTRYYECLDEGFLLANADTFIADSTVYLSLTQGEKFLLHEVHFSRDSVLGTNNHVKRAFGPSALKRVFTNAIAEFENSGFPFASIQIDSLMDLPSRNNKVRYVDVFTTIQTGPIIVNDSLYVRSKQSLPVLYLRNYIDFKTGRLYNETRIQQTEKRLREIPFLQVKRAPEVRFSAGKADLFLFVERKKANYFNAVAGLRPDEQTGRTNITGDAEVRLMNAFNRGEELGLVWRKLQPLTQDLTVRAMAPYLFRSPLALDGRLQIYKRDTSFTSVKLLAGVGVILPRNQRIRAFAERNRTDRLTNYYTAGGLASAQHTLYGLSAQLESLDYRWNPRRGYSFQVECATGYRSTNLPLASESATIRRPLTRVEAQSEYYVPILKTQALMFGVKGAWMMSDSLYENEVYRIGGLRTIRGINEESIYATAWGAVTMEYRWLLEENSALFVFVDLAWYEYKSNLGYVRDVPINFGAGFNFETKAGIFTFNYALGKQFDNPVLVRNGKISFGFRSLF
jgi:outer membrane protein assembly factor BamA